MIFLHPTFFFFLIIWDIEVCLEQYIVCIGSLQFFQKWKKNLSTVEHYDIDPEKKRKTLTCDVDIRKPSPTRGKETLKRRERCLSKRTDFEIFDKTKMLSSVLGSRFRESIPVSSLFSCLSFIYTTKSNGINFWDEDRY